MKPMPSDEAKLLALLVDEFFMTEGQVLLRGDAPGTRTQEGVSIPLEALERRLAPEGARRLAELQRAAAALLDANPGRAADFRDRVEAASADALPALHREIAADPFFRAVARRAVEIFFLYYPTWDSYVGTVHPGAARHPERYPQEAGETREHYRLMEAGRKSLGGAP